MTVVRFFEVREPDGPDAPGHYALLDDLVYLGPWPSPDEAKAALDSLAREAGGIDALVEQALRHTRLTRRRSSAATSFVTRARTSAERH
jgi:hypothetical protein